MNSPYIIALVTPLPLLCDFFVKNVTVTGIIGNTQGVSNAINPPRKPNKNTVRRLLCAVSSSPQSLTGFLILMDEILILANDCMPPSRATENAYGVDGYSS